jgi:hypothetical protein
MLLCLTETANYFVVFSVSQKSLCEFRTAGK